MGRGGRGRGRGEEGDRKGSGREEEGERREREGPVSQPSTLSASRSKSPSASRVRRSPCAPLKLFLAPLLARLATALRQTVRHAS